ncbi:hypothetical protein HU200_027718 [Digitaria exilis]|uniref:Uncharacterized protein n=1 Tax=Digitaria exilis TaxID=1010633 RepID=A0A835BXJ6_9POAL|nr:hypothetical protein HU200_027718 [Digitaria exilis]
MTPSPPRRNSSASRSGAAPLRFLRRRREQLVGTQAVPRGATLERVVAAALSCDRVFHFRKGAKSAGNTIDDWLRENRMRCPVCCRIAYPVLPWKAPPTYIAATVDAGFGGSSIAAVGDGGGATSSSTAVATTDAVVAVVQGYITATVAVTVPVDTHDRSGASWDETVGFCVLFSAMFVVRSKLPDRCTAFS